MINIARSPNPPASLDTPEIKKYINDTSLHLNDPQHHPKPDKPVDYRNSDLLEAFDRDFHSKCYLTEQKFENSWIMDIEHFLPQSERPDLVYSWPNLFPAEHYSNMIKPRVTPPGGYLDPCEPNDNVETEIIYTLSAMGISPHFESAIVTNQKAVNTCNLLNRLHNGHDENTKKATATLRFAIQKKYDEILHKINDFLYHPDGSQEKYQAQRELKDLLSRKNSFTMLCRSMVAVRRLPADFFD